MGFDTARTHGDGPQALISNLGLFDFINGKMRLISYHSGVTVDRIKARTGFELEIAEDIHETLPPSEEELRLIREVIDPLGIRRLESLSGAARKELIKEILEKEKTIN